MRFEGSTGQVWVGGHTTTNVTPGIFNVFSGTNENGLFIRSVNNSSSHYGLRIQMSNASSNAIEVLNNTQTASSVNFRVKTNGFVYARKYTTTLTNFPDYVFDANYKLMPLSTLRAYIQTNKHLPNVPTAKQVEAVGADLGELNRVLVEKVEELTLYILQLEERLQKLEIQK